MSDEREQAIDALLRDMGKLLPDLICDPRPMANQHFRHRFTQAVERYVERTALLLTNDNRAEKDKLTVLNKVIYRATYIREKGLRRDEFMTEAETDFMNKAAALVALTSRNIGPKEEDFAIRDWFIQRKAEQEGGKS